MPQRVQLPYTQGTGEIPLDQALNRVFPGGIPAAMELYTMRISSLLEHILRDIFSSLADLWRNSRFKLLPSSLNSGGERGTASFQGR